MNKYQAYTQALVESAPNEGIGGKLFGKTIVDGQKIANHAYTKHDIVRVADIPEYNNPHVNVIGRDLSVQGPAENGHVKVKFAGLTLKVKLSDIKTVTPIVGQAKSKVTEINSNFFKGK